VSVPRYGNATIIGVGERYYDFDRLDQAPMGTFLVLLGKPGVIGDIGV
jgi:hypothetical protein